MLITNKTAIELTQAIRAIDDGKFKFGSATAYAFARNLRRLSEICEDFDTTRAAMLKKHGLGGEKKAGETDNPLDVAAFRQDMETLLDTSVEVPITGFKVADLNLDTNNIQISVLAALDPILSE